MLDYPESYLDFIVRYTKLRPCVVVAPDYKRSIDEPYPAGFNYPMIDYRQITESAKAMQDTPVWNSKTSAFAWGLCLKDIKDDMPLYASPALNKNYKNSPPTITFVGDYKPFKDEMINYKLSLNKAQATNATRTYF